MLTKFLLAKPGGRAGCGLLQSYLRDQSCVNILGEQFNLKDKQFRNPQNWLDEIKRIYDYAHPGKKARGCALKPNAPSMTHWTELRRQISVVVPDLRVIFLGRNYVRQYAASVAAMTYTDDQLPVLIDLDHMLGIFSVWEFASLKLRQIFEHHNHLQLKYEDLIQQPRNTVNLVFQFLGFSPDGDLEIRPESDVVPAEIIKNFDEVRQVLRGTSWSGLCDNPH